MAALGLPTVTATFHVGDANEREALAAALAQVGGEEIEYQPGYFVWQMELEIRDLFIANLRERLALLPEKCEHGESSYHLINGLIANGSCPGKVYPAELVERIARVFRKELMPNNPRLTRAVLDALNGETE